MRSDAKPEPLPPPKEWNTRNPCEKMCMTFVLNALNAFYANLKSVASLGQARNAAQSRFEHFPADGEMTPGEVIRGVFFAPNHHVGGKEFPDGARFDLLDDGRLEVHEHGPGHLFAGAALGEERTQVLVVVVVVILNRLVGWWDESVVIDAVLQAEKFPTSLADLTTGLTHVNCNAFTHIVVFVITSFVTLLFQVNRCVTLFAYFPRLWLLSPRNSARNDDDVTTRSSHRELPSVSFSSHSNHPQSESRKQAAGTTCSLVRTFAREDSFTFLLYPSIARRMPWILQWPALLHTHTHIHTYVQCTGTLVRIFVNAAHAKVDLESPSQATAAKYARILMSACMMMMMYLRRYRFQSERRVILIICAYPRQAKHSMRTRNWIGTSDTHTNIDVLHIHEWRTDIIIVSCGRT